MTRAAILVLVLVATPACKKQRQPDAPPQAPAARAAGVDYTVPIPLGWVQDTLDDRTIPPGGLTLRRTAAAHYDAMLRILPLERTLGFDGHDLERCRSVADEVAGAAPGTVKSEGLIATRYGRACQIDLLYAHGALEGLMTVLEGNGPKDVWQITCNHHPSDTQAATDCQTVLDGFRFDFEPRDGGREGPFTSEASPVPREAA